MAVTDAVGDPAPPVVSRELIEQQRACELLASHIAARLDKYSSVEWNIEADIAPTLTRYVVHFCHSGQNSRSNCETVEVNFGPGDPIGNEGWLNDVAMRILETIYSGTSDLVFVSSLNYLRLVNERGETIYMRGKPWE